MRGSGRVATLFLAAMVALLGWFAVPVLADEQGTPDSIDELLEVYGVADQPADFVVVIDTSSSMSSGAEPIYPEVRDAYASFLNATNEGDFLSLITFDTTAKLRFGADLTGDARDEALNSLPASAEGAGTNIGAALRMTIDQLGRADAHDVQIVVFLTDGEPTVDADYAAMRADADAATQGRQVRVLGASLGASEKTGSSLLEEVFPGRTDVVALPNEQLGTIFDDAVKQARIAQLYQPIRDEIQQGAIKVTTADVTLDDPVRVQFTLTNDYGHLGATIVVEGATVSTRDGEALPTVLVGGRRTITLAPGETSEPLVAEADTDVADAPIRIGRVTEEQYFQVSVNASVRVEPSDLIFQNVGLETEGKVSQEPQTKAARTFGVAYWQAGAALAVAVLLAWLLVFLWLRFVATPRLWGTLVVVKGTKDYKLRGKKVTIPNAQVKPAGTKNKMGSADFSTRRGKFHLGKPQIFVTTNGDASITSRGHRVEQKPHRMLRGDVVKLELAELVFQDKKNSIQQEKQ